MGCDIAGGRASPSRSRPARVVATAKPKRLGYEDPMDASQMGRRGGQSKSSRKRAAARRNGRRGGRPRSAELFARRVHEACARLQPQMPRVDPGDLRSIVRCLLLPPAQRAVFVVRRKDGRYVF